MANIYYEKSKLGLMTIKFEGLYLHSKYNPINEAQNFVKQKYKSSNIQLLIGYGLGYIYKELKGKIQKDEKIIVIDPLYSQIENKIIDEDIILLDSANIQELKSFYSKHISLLDNINIIVSINYDKVLNNDLKKILSVLEEKVKSNAISENTITFQLDQWHENYIKNLKFAFNDDSFNSLIGKFDKPIVVASGGPSLTKQLSIVKEYRENIILIAAGTTYNSLLVNNIIPDYIVSTDGGIINYQHFKNFDKKQIPLIYCPTLHYKIRPKFEKAYYFMPAMEESLKNHYERFSKKNVEIIMDGSSVANSAYNLALLMTSGPVALIGQDLAYTDGETHAEGNINRKIINKDHLNKSAIEAKGYYGNLVKTDNVFLQMRDCFENIVQNNSESHRSYNCTEGGLHINYFKNTPFKNFLEKYATSKCDINHAENKVENYSDEYVKNLKIDVEKMIKIKNLLKEARTILEKNDSQFEYKLITLQKLDAIDLKLQKHMENTTLFYAFNLVNLRLLKYFKTSEEMSKKDRFTISLKQNKYMYSEMLKVVENALILIRNELDLKV